jgi:hypothetical protein
MIALSFQSINRICDGTRIAYERPQGNVQDKSRSIFIPRFTVLSEALKSNYQVDDIMSRALDTLTCQVYRCAIEAAADPACEKATREDYLKLIVRLFKSDGQLLYQEEDIRTVSDSVDGKYFLSDPLGHYSKRYRSWKNDSPKCYLP